MEYNIFMEDIVKLKVKFIGEKAFSFFEEDRLFIIYGCNIKDKDLISYSVIVESEHIKQDIKENMILSFNNQYFKILKVGEEANKTLKALNHMTLRFEESVLEEYDIMPGTIILYGFPKNLPSEGDYIVINNG